ncbi:MAG: Holliday junction resolvase [Thermoplasmatota archaeon]
MGTEYERELKKLLEGNLQAVVKMKKTCSAGEALGYGICERYPFMVIRGAGSFGVDLVALRGELSFPIEVKSSVHEKVYLSQPRLREQLQVFTEECRRANTFPIYAFRLKNKKGDPWRVFTIQMDGLKYFSRTINSKIPPLRRTAGGNFVMEWSEGMSLSTYLLEIGKIIEVVHRN